MVKHGTNKKRRAGRTGKTKLKVSETPLQELESSFVTKEQISHIGCHSFMNA
jgi:hypothetical protein